VSERRVLIIEPEDDMALMIERFLRSSGFEVARARDAHQGKWMAPLISPHVVLLDSGPDDGVKIARIFRNGGELEDVPLVMMVPEDIDEAQPELVDSLRDMFDGFLYKPFADTELLRVVENFTGFGESSDMDAVLDNLLNDGSSGPELENVVMNIKKSKKKGNRKEIEHELSEKVRELEAKLKKTEEESGKQAARISELLDKISEYEIDQESLESEKVELEKRVCELSERIRQMEKVCGEAGELINSAGKMLKKARRGK